VPQRIHYDQFELGIDLRKDESISDANRLVDCLNAYVTSGWSIKPRPGLTNVGTLTAGTEGLMAFNGKIQTFSDSKVTHDNLTDGVGVVDNEVPNVAYDIIDDNFTANNGWTLGPGCTIGGTMVWDGTQTSESESYRNIHAKDNVGYVTSFKVTVTAGTITAYLGDQAGTEHSATDATFSENVTMDGTNGRIRFIADSDFVGSIDDLTVGGTGAVLFTDNFNTDKGWTYGGTWTRIWSQVKVSGAGGTAEVLSKDISLVNGTTYEVEFTVANFTSGGVFVRLGTNVGTTQTANGSYRETLAMDEAGGEIEFVTSASGSDLRINTVIVRESAGVGEISGVSFADVFNGAIYVAAKYDNSDTKHHYISGDKDATTGYIVVDENCPHSDANLINGSKLWSVDYDVVRYCATDAPTDWTTADDAGFLPTGTRAPGSEQAIALGDFQGQLVVFAVDAIQIWNIDPDPTQNSLDRIIGNVGARYPRSVQPVAGDLYFLTDVGFRSIAYQRYTENVEDVDIGTPIDDLVRPELAGLDDQGPHSVFYTGGGQYWGFVDDQIFVYTFSRTSKVAAWTRYTLPVTVDYAANLGGTLYLRSGDEVYKLDPDATDDDGTPYQVTVKMAFQSAQAPGVNKTFHGFDAVVEGSVDISHRFDPNNTTVESDAITVTGDSRIGQLFPCGITTTSIAPVFKNSTGTLERINAISYVYDKIGAF